MRVAVGQDPREGRSFIFRDKEEAVILALQRITQYPQLAVGLDLGIVARRGGDRLTVHVESGSGRSKAG
jgi:hypothetical protein